MIVVEILLGLVVVWSFATVLRTGYRRVKDPWFADDDSARFMVGAAQVLALALGFLGLLLK
jgi:hypothetical protein